MIERPEPISPSLSQVDFGALDAMQRDSISSPQAKTNGERPAVAPKHSDEPISADGVAGQPGTLPRFVTWQRANGESVTEKDEKVTQLPLDARAGVDPERQMQLDAMGEKLLKPYQSKPINFTQIGDILENIAKDPNLTEKERANVWDSLSKTINDSKTHWSKEGANPFVLNVNRTWRIAHEVFGLDDGYHASYLSSSDSANDGRLAAHNFGSTAEDYFVRVGPTAHNDVTNEIAPRYQIQCLRAYLKGGFASYATNWNAYFVSHLPQERNDDYYQKIYGNTATLLFPTVDRRAIAKLQTDYFNENKKAAPGVYVPEPVSLRDPAEDERRSYMP